MAKISAHETLFLHNGTASTAAFALITVSNPSPASERLSGWSFSALLFPVDATKTEASQPCGDIADTTLIGLIIYTVNEGMKWNACHAIGYLHEAIMEEETEGSRDRDECLMKFLFNRFSDDVFDIGACFCVVVST